PHRSAPPPNSPVGRSHAGRQARLLARRPRRRNCRRQARDPSGSRRRAYLLPSPSLGPPLLSLSPSPPLFCGIPAAADSDAGEAGAAGAATFEAVDEGEDELELEEPPQPATISASTPSV